MFEDGAVRCSDSSRECSAFLSEAQLSRPRSRHFSQCLISVRCRLAKCALKLSSCCSLATPRSWDSALRIRAPETVLSVSIAHPRGSLLFPFHLQIGDQQTTCNGRSTLRTRGTCICCSQILVVYAMPSGCRHGGTKATRTVRSTCRRSCTACACSASRKICRRPKGAETPRVRLRNVLIALPIDPRSQDPMALRMSRNTCEEARRIRSLTPPWTRRRRHPSLQNVK